MKKLVLAIAVMLSYNLIDAPKPTLSSEEANVVQAQQVRLRTRRVRRRRTVIRRGAVCRNGRCG